MANPVDILNAMLSLEQTDASYSDRAVFRGLASHAEHWERQAMEHYGEAARPWIDDVAARLRAYSARPKERPVILSALLGVVNGGPEAFAAGAIPGALPAVGVGTRSTQGSQAPASTIPEAAPSATRSAPSRRPRQDQGLSGRGLSAPASMISGIGPRGAEYLEKLGVQTIRDLLFLLPRRYEDFSAMKTISQLRDGDKVTLLGTVWDAGGRDTRRGLYMYKAVISDATGTLEVIWFNKRYLAKQVKAGMHLLLSGTVSSRAGVLTLSEPEFEPVGVLELRGTQPPVKPMYPLTEGLTQRRMRMWMERALEGWAARVPEVLPADILRDHDLLPVGQALWAVHRPERVAQMEAGRRRMAFEEVLLLQLGLQRQKLLWRSQPGRVIVPQPAFVDRLLASMPYVLTGAQQRSVREMLRDFGSGEPMNRLLEGDVGSGKTAVAALLMAVTVANGSQAALMAPTEILAEQHYRSILRLFEGFPEPRPTVGLLTGSTAGGDRDAIYQGLADGSLEVVVGTHALIQEGVVYKDLAFTVVDEQHRFGVEQRSALRQKGFNPHLLVMTATPIPRSLELTVWGHLDVSILDEMPPGRQPIETWLLRHDDRERAYKFIQSQIAMGHQAFIIYPLVEASDQIEARAAVDEYERLRGSVFPGYRLGLLHGRMRSEDKDVVMAGFVSGELQILVATSVVEVGIDVPNATVMLIDGAERFGLAQLHQFRGRVGRGEAKSYCLLLPTASAENENERLKAIEKITDGFVLAEKDLEMRGPGQFLGTQQSGFPELPTAMATDIRLLHEVRAVAQHLLEQDPDLEQPEHRVLSQRVAEFWRSAGELS